MVMLVFVEKLAVGFSDHTGGVVVYCVGDFNGSSAKLGIAVDQGKVGVGFISFDVQDETGDGAGFEVVVVCFG